MEDKEGDLTMDGGIVVNDRLVAGRACSTKSLGSGTLGATTLDLTFFRASRAAASLNLASSAA